MISKVCARGRRVQGLLYYLFTEGQAGEKQLSSDHTDPRVVAGFDPPQYLQPGRTPDGRRDFGHLVQMLTQPLYAAHVTPDHRPVYHLVAAAAKDPQTGQLRDRLLSDAEWGEIAEEYMHRLGLARRGDDLGVRWIAVRHADDHIHVIATLATLDGRRVHPHNDYYKARAASHAIERRYGLTSTAPADRTAVKRPTRAETEKLARTRRQRAAEGQPVPRLTDREQLRRHVRVAAAGSHSLPEFLGRLERAGVMVRLRYSEQHPDQVTGYAVALPDRRPAPQEPIWFGGGKLAPDLTLPKLQHRFASADDGGRDTLAREHQWTVGKTSGKTPHRERARVAGPHRSPHERLQVWRHASVAAARATQHIHAAALSNPSGAADAAWAAGDLLFAAAHVVDGRRGGPLTKAAEAYDRAARELYGRVPAPTSPGRGLRRAARLLVDAGRVLNPRSELAQLAVLLTQLIALAQAVEQLRRAQERPVQARAARLAAEHLSTRQQGPPQTSAVRQAVTLTSGPWTVAPPPATPTGAGPMQEPLAQSGPARAGPSRR
jgi:hypothetical protein